MENFTTSIVAVRYAPFAFSIVPSFLNNIPDINMWVKCLPRFREDDDDIPSQYLQDFHD